MAKKRTRTHADLARLLGVAESSISFYKRQGMPINGSIEQIRAWKAQWDEEKQAKGGSGSSASESERARYWRAATLDKVHSAKLKEIRIKERDRVLIPAEEARREIQRLVNIVRERLLGFRNQAGEFLGVKSLEKMEEKLDSFAREVLNAMADDAANEEDDDG